MEEQKKLIEQVDALNKDTAEKVEKIEKKRTKPSDFLEEDIHRAKTQILIGLQKPSMHVYGGTVPAEVVRQRRAKNKAARKARRANRKQ